MTLRRLNRPFEPNAFRVFTSLISSFFFPLIARMATRFLRQSRTQSHPGRTAEGRSQELRVSRALAFHHTPHISLGRSPNQCQKIASSRFAP